MKLMFTQHMTYILAQKTFDAFAKFLHTVNIFLRHSPRAILRIGWSGFEFFDFFLYREIP